MPHTIFSVIPVNDRWDIVINGQGRYVNFLSKDSAIEEAKRLARNQTPSRVEITDDHGNVAIVATFGALT